MPALAHLAPLTDFLFPPRCPLCGASIADHGALCSDCWQLLVLPGSPACRLCQRPFIGADAPDGSVCAPCLARPPRHAGIAAATLYNDASKRLILSFKRGGRIALAPLLARMMAARLPEVTHEWLIAPVPLHRTRLWTRGYNQSALLGREIAQAKQATLVVDALQRIRRTPRLGGLGRAQRARTLAGTIQANPQRRAALAGRAIVLVDDVMTSGATTEACVKVLLRAGARQVLIACFARVLDEARPSGLEHLQFGSKEAPGTEVPGALS